jgi:predicted dienelactone hydrolase
VNKTRPPRRSLKILLVLALLPFAGVALVLGLLRLDHDRATTLPMPTGSFAVGRTLAVWSDPAYPDPLAPPPGATRELAVWIWYPAAPAPPGQPAQPAADYLPAPWRAALTRQIGPLLSQLLTRDLAGVHAHATADAAVSPAQPAYPVVLMRPGLAALTADYTTLAEDLASHGYVVVGFDAPYRSFVVVFADGRTIARAPANDADLVGGAEKVALANKLLAAWCADLGFVLDRLDALNASDPSGRFQGRLDLDRVGVFGHSLGGATALQFTHDDPRVKAGIDVDGLPLGSVIADGVAKPFMFLMSDHSQESGPETTEVEANIRSIYDRIPADHRWLVTLRGAHHFGFTDISPLPVRLMRALGKIALAGPRQIALTEHLIDAFFDVYLRNAPAAALKPRPEYPEIEYGQ